MTTVTYVVDPAPPAFEDAWVELGKRLRAGLAELHNADENADEATEVTRLMDKYEGVHSAHEIYWVLNDENDGDYATMWRTYTAQVMEILDRDGQAKGTYQGAHLALTYQYSHGPKIDIPYILKHRNL